MKTTRMMATRATKPQESVSIYFLFSGAGQLLGESRSRSNLKPDRPGADCGLCWGGRGSSVGVNSLQQHEACDGRHDKNHAQDRSINDPGNSYHEERDNRRNKKGNDGKTDFNERPKEGKNTRKSGNG